jgi:hypothetical protein
LANKKGVEVLPHNTVADVCKKLCSAYPIVANHSNAYRQWHEQFLYQEETKVGYYSAIHNLFKLTAALIFSPKNNSDKEV